MASAQVHSATQVPKKGGTAPSLTVFAPSSSVTVTVERGIDDRDDIHFHAGGQGVWIARTVVRLGEQPRLCTSTGGEAGRVLESLVAEDGIGLCATRVRRETSAYVHDRRSGERRVVAENAPGTLGRHEVDDLYEMLLADALETGMVVLSGRRRPDDVPDDFYRRLSRLGSDLAMADVEVIGDLHGAELAAFLKGGPVSLLKVSSDDLVADGVSVDDDDECFAAIAELQAAGVRDVVLTRGNEPALAVLGQVRLRATMTTVESPDHRGSGDAMTGALAVGVLRGLDAIATLSLGCGAGAASATRHGLATADARLIAHLADLCQVETVTDSS